MSFLWNQPKKNLCPFIRYVRDRFCRHSVNISWYYTIREKHSINCVLANKLKNMSPLSRTHKFKLFLLWWRSCHDIKFNHFITSIIYMSTPSHKILMLSIYRTCYLYTESFHSSVYLDVNIYLIHFEKCNSQGTNFKTISWKNGFFIVLIFYVRYDSFNSTDTVPWYAKWKRYVSLC